MRNAYFIGFLLIGAMLLGVVEAFPQVASVVIIELNNTGIYLGSLAKKGAAIEPISTNPAPFTSKGGFMALVNCPECQEEVSGSATKCPKCGFQIKKPKRGLFGKLFKYAFIAFNILMVIWLVVGMQGASEVFQGATSEAEQAGAAIGTGLGAAMIVAIWIAGDFILGLFVLFTRPKG